MMVHTISIHAVAPLQSGTEVPTSMMNILLFFQAGRAKAGSSAMPIKHALVLILKCQLERFSRTRSA